MSAKRLYPEQPILIVDDEDALLFSYANILEEENINNIISCSDSRNVIKLIETHTPELILLDLLMPNISGKDLLPVILEKYPDIKIVVITGDTAPSTIVRCIKSGVYDYIDKPVSRERLITTVRNALSLNMLQRENKLLISSVLSADRLKNPDAFSEIITSDTTMFSIFKYIEAIANSPYPVLITGETGTGKELIAKAIYRTMKPKGKFVAVNVSGLDDNMFLDTLFGHKKGAFTGALRDRKGLIEQAAGGALFLDEIGDLSPNSQIKLLRLLQEHEYQPLGSDVTLYAHTRIICATNRQLRKMSQNGNYRDDLFYRLSTHHIHLPPLRERKNDMGLLIEHFIKRNCSEWNIPHPEYSLSDILEVLKDYAFPGNIRELESCVADVMVRCQSGKLSHEMFKTYISSPESNREPDKNIPEQDNYSENSNLSTDENVFSYIEKLPPLKNVQLMLIKEALKRAYGNKTLAAKLLCTSRQAINWHLKTKK